jgi:hypothetical protein
MRRLAALALVLCAGCANNEDYLWHDTMLGDVYSRFCPKRPYSPSPPDPAAFYGSVPTGGTGNGAAPQAGTASSGK